ncbi:hypothetical protein SAMN05518672_103591 [Chitinophaga sp. CF118]|nr:hypothetical protein SAMN05518672_103591 [Chitinophaga sp. CF118]
MAPVTRSRASEAVHIQTGKYNKNKHIHYGF